MNAEQIVKDVITDLPDVDFELRKGEALKFYHRGFMKFESEDSATDLEIGTFILTNERCGVVEEGGYEHPEHFLPLKKLRVMDVAQRYFRELEALRVPGLVGGWTEVIELKLPVGNLGLFTTGSYFVGFVPYDRQLCFEVNGAIRTLAELSGMTNRPARGASTTIIIERQVVMIRCRYCGTLADPVANTTCPNCGGKLL